MDPDDPQPAPGSAGEGGSGPWVEGDDPLTMFGWTPAHGERGPGRPVGPFGPFDPFEPPVPYDDEFDDEPMRRRWPLPVRAMAAVVAGSLILAAVASGVGIFIDGSHASFATTVTRMSLAPVKGKVPYEQLAINVTNTGDAVGRPVCMVQVLHTGRVIGAAAVPISEIVAPSAVVTLTVDIPVQGTDFAGTAPQADVVCRPG
ncbi:MAG TPA: hypothetical protein VK277_08985 [Acidimicrobiales bacterium]|nr:hypothetical protein [Acidimicrobiales bacterium]